VRVVDTARRALVLPLPLPPRGVQLALRSVGRVGWRALVVASGTARGRRRTWRYVTWYVLKRVTTKCTWPSTHVEVRHMVCVETCNNQMHVAVDARGGTSHGMCRNV